jgi:hypothetical protein
MKFLPDTDHISILQKQSGAEYTALMRYIAQAQRADLAEADAHHRTRKRCGGRLGKLSESPLHERDSEPQGHRGTEKTKICFRKLVSRQAQLKFLSLCIL